MSKIFIQDRVWGDEYIFIKIKKYRGVWLVYLKELKTGDILPFKLSYVFQQFYYQQWSYLEYEN